MKPRIIILIVAWAISLPIAWGLGYMRGNTVRISKEEAHKSAQVDYLMKTAYFTDEEGRSSLPTLAVLQKVRSLSERPEEVRVYLMDVQTEGIDAASKNIEKEPGPGISPRMLLYSREMDFRINIREALQSWKPGQTGPIDEKAPKQ